MIGNLMNIKNIFLIIILTSTNIHTMELPHSYEKTSSQHDEKYRNYLQKEVDYAWEQFKNTEEYKKFQEAHSIHKYYNTSDTLQLYKEAAQIMCNTEKINIYLEAKDQLEAYIKQSSSYTNTERSLHDIETKHARYVQTPQYQTYERAKKLHEKHHTQETFIVMEQAAQLLLETPESQALMQTVERKQPEVRSVEEFSDNVLLKHRAMQETDEFMQYEQAKKYYDMYPTADTECMVKECKTALYNTKECQIWLHATEQEIHVVNNIMQSEKWHNNTQQKTYTFPGLSDEGKRAQIKYAENLQKRVKIAREAIINSPEGQQYTFAKANHEQHNIANIYQHIVALKQSTQPKAAISKLQQHNQTLLTLRQAEDNLKNTKESLEYCKLKEEVRQLLTAARGYAPIFIIKPNVPSCTINYIQYEKFMHEHDLNIIPIQRTSNIPITHKKLILNPRSLYNQQK